MGSGGDGGEDSDGKTSSNAGGVFVIGATNRPDLMDPALLRPGRFGKLIYLGVTRDPQQKLLILKALTGKMPLSEDTDLSQLVNSSTLSETLTGADLASLVSEAAMLAISRTIKVVERTGNKEQRVKVNLEDFTQALKTLVPSVSKEELISYESLKQNLRK